MSAHFQSSHFGSSQFGSSHFGRLAVIPPLIPEVIHPMGSDPNWAARRAKILREDDEILAIVMAFMETKD